MDATLNHSFTHTFASTQNSKFKTQNSSSFPVSLYPATHHLLGLEEWVKVWVVNHWVACEYCCTCQVKDLMQAIAPFLQDVLLEDIGLELL
jgi:hypothetical protein